MTPRCSIARENEASFLLLPHWVALPLVDVVEHGQWSWPRATPPLPPAMPSWCRTRRCARRSSAAFAPSESVRALLAITEQKTLLEQNPLLARSIRNRFPYIDPSVVDCARRRGRIVPPAVVDGRLANALVGAVIGMGETDIGAQGRSYGRWSWGPIN
jgi:hypothetical protein